MASTLGLPMARGNARIDSKLILHRGYSVGDGVGDFLPMRSAAAIGGFFLVADEATLHEHGYALGLT